MSVERARRGSVTHSVKRFDAFAFSWPFGIDMSDLL